MTVSLSFEVDHYRAREHDQEHVYSSGHADAMNRIWAVQQQMQFNYAQAVRSAETIELRPLPDAIDDAMRDMGWLI